MKARNPKAYTLKRTLLATSLILLASCSSIKSGNFQKRKYLDFKRFHASSSTGIFSAECGEQEVSELDVNTEHQMKVLPVINDTDTAATAQNILQDSSATCDTIHLKNGEVKLVEVRKQTLNKIYYSDCGNDVEAWKSLPKSEIREVKEYNQEGQPTEDYTNSTENSRIRKVAMVLLILSVATLIALLLSISSLFWFELLIAIFVLSTIGYISMGFALKLDKESMTRISKLSVIALVSLVIMGLTGLIALIGVFGALVVAIPAAIVFLIAMILLSAAIFK